MPNSAIVGMLRALLVADTADFEQAMTRAGARVGQTVKELKDLGQNATAIGKTLTASITLPLTALAAGASKLAIDFESSFAGVRKTVDASESEFAAMAAQFRELSKEIPINVNELNALGESAGALGIAKTDIVDFAKVMAELGVTTNLTSDQAATAIARIQNIFGAAGKDTDRFGATLVALGNAGASTETEIVEMAQRIAGAGHTIGLTQSQVLSFASALSSVGIDAEAGGTAISRVFLAMNEAVQGGGKELAAFGKAAGMSAAEFKQAFQTDAAGAVVAFVDNLGKMRAENENVSGTLKELFGENVRLTDVLLRVSGAGKLLTDQLAIGNQAWKDNTALTTEATKRFETTASQLTILWNRIKDVGITLGEALLPTIKALTGALDFLLPILEGIVKAFTTLPAPVQVAVIALAGLAAALGPALVLFGQATLGLGNLTNAFKEGGTATLLFSKALPFLKSPITWLIAGLGALALVIYEVATAESDLEKELHTNAAGFRKNTDELQSAIDTYDALKDAQNLTKDETEALAGATDTLARMSGASVDAFKREEAKSNELTAALREQLSTRRELNKEYAEEARRTLMEEQSKLLDIQDALNREIKKQGAGKTTAPVFMGEGVYMTREQGADERLAATEALNKQIAEQNKRVEEARQKLESYTGVVSKDIALKGKQTTATKTQTDAVAELDKEQKAYNDSVESLAKTYSVLGVTEKIQRLSDALDFMAKGSGVAADQVDALVKEIDKYVAAGYPITDSLAKYRLAHIELVAAMMPVEKSTKELINLTPDLAGEAIRAGEAQAGLSEKYQEFNNRIGGPEGATALLKKFKNEVALAPPPIKWIDTLFQDFGKDLGEAINRAFQGGGQVGKSIGGSLMGSLMGSSADWTTAFKGLGLGKTLSGVFGSIVPGLGTALGGMLGDLIGKAFHRTAGRDLVTQFADSLGGFDELHKKLGVLGDEGERLWVSLTQGVGRNNPGQAQAAIDQVTGALGRYDDQQKEVAKNQELLRQNAGTLQSALQEFGGVVPASLRPTVEALLGMSGLPDELRGALQAASQDPSWQTMQSKAQALGIDLAALGPKFNEARLSDIALGYVRDLGMFADAGADMTGVLKGMSDELSTMYQEAKKNGVALPETLKPYMQSLADMGLLVDENGKKVENLNDVAFKDIEDKSLRDVVDVLKDIKDLLAKQLPDAAREGAKGMQEQFDRHPLTVRYDMVAGDRFDPENPPPRLGLWGGTHGEFVDWGSGTPVMLHGKERVVTEGEALGGTDINITVVSKLDGREVARNQVKYIPNQLMLAGV